MSSNAFLDSVQVKSTASGKWLNILSSLAPQLNQAIEKKGKHVPCPNPTHKSKDGFRLFRDSELKGAGVCNTCGLFHDGFALLEWVNGWDFRTTLEEVAHELRIDCSNGHRVQPCRPTPAVVERPMTEEEKTKQAKLRHRLNTIWQEAVPLDSPLAATAWEYFNRRGFGVYGMYGKTVLKAVGANIRFHPALTYWHGKIWGRYPALLAMIRNADNKPVTLHRIFLTKNGSKLDTSFVDKNIVDELGYPSAKKMMPIPAGKSITGGAIRIDNQPSPVLSVAEGLETALAVRHATKTPVWSTINATLLGKLDPPSCVKQLLIWADKDQSQAGSIAAKELQSRMQDRGVDAKILLPPMELANGQKSWDWNDVLKVKGTKGFPKI